MERREDFRKATEALAARLNEALGDNLISSVLHSYDFRGVPVPDLADLDVLIILRESTPSALTAINEATDGRVRAAARVLSKREIDQDFQSFALTMRGVFRRYLPLAGEDPFKAFELDMATSKFLVDHSRKDLRRRAARPPPTPDDEEGIYRIAAPPADDEGWESSSLSDEGIDPYPIAELVARIRRDDYVGIDGLLKDRAFLDRFWTALRAAGLPDKPPSQRSPPSKAEIELASEKPSIAVLPFDNLSRDEGEDSVNLDLLVEGSEALFNPYGVIATNPKLHPTVNYHGAVRFVEWVTSQEAARIISNYRIQGEQLFVPDLPPNGN